MARPREHVDGASFTPLPFGLLSSLKSEIRSPTSPHWEGGVTFETLCGNSGSTYSECLAVSGVGSRVVAPAAVPPAKVETASLEFHGALPFTVYAEVDCSAPGFWDRAEESVRGVISRSEEREVERALWTGVTGGALVVHPHLASNRTTLDDKLHDPSGNPTGPNIYLDTAAVTVITGAGIVEGLGALEDALAKCYDGVGVIHVPRRLGPSLGFVNSLLRVGDHYVTHNGNVVVLGSGYTGTGPDGTGNDWIYATSMPFIYRSVTRVFRPRESIDRSTNTVYAIAEITYVIGWDCCHLAAQITNLVG